MEEWDRELILAAAGETPALVLTELTLAGELLAQVARALQPTRITVARAAHTDLA